MNGSTKNTVLVGIIVVCLVAAGVITYATRGRKGPDLSPFADETTWVLCRNPNCGESYEMNLKKYYEFRQKNADPRSPLPPALPCEVCRDPESVYRAVRCKCGHVFERNTVPADFADRCPECDYSQIEVDRREGVEARRASKE
jgi:hypothetical protein